jgi:hypothetical protein
VLRCRQEGTGGLDINVGVTMGGSARAMHYTLRPVEPTGWQL